MTSLNSREFFDVITDGEFMLARDLISKDPVMRRQKTRTPIIVMVLVTVMFSGSLQAEHDGKIQILLLGDSTTEVSVPRLDVPKGPHLEDVIRELLAREKIRRPRMSLIQGSAASISGDC